MKIKLIIATVFLSLGSFFGSCKKDISSSISEKKPDNFSQIFDIFWDQMNINYVYWDIDTTNWNNIYIKYKPVFAQLNLRDNNDVKKSVEYFKQMTDGLIDSHYNLSFIPDNISNLYVYPALNRKISEPNFHSPFLYMSIDSSYFDKEFMSGNYLTNSKQNLFVLSATIKNKILYFYCNQFALKEAYNSSIKNEAQKTLQYFFEQLQNLPSNINGIIIDVRNNSGGNIVDLDFLVGRLIDKPILFGYTHYKSGNGRMSYTPWIESIVRPQPFGKFFSIPIIVLADNYSKSLAETVAIAIHTLPNGIFIGENTWGATGPITDNIIYNDGQFIVPNFLSVYTSSAAFKYIDNKSYENIGFPPDITVPFNLISLQNGRDLQLEKAISLVK